MTTSTCPTVPGVLERLGLTLTRIASLNTAAHAVNPGLTMFTNIVGLFLSAALLAAGSVAVAQPVAMEDRLILRGAVADVTPQQKYRTAINEAGGGYKVYLEDCAKLAAAERTTCRRDAQALYNRDMVAARQILRSK